MDDIRTEPDRCESATTWKWPKRLDSIWGHPAKALPLDGSRDLPASMRLLARLVERIGAKALMCKDLQLLAIEHARGICMSELIEEIREHEQRDDAMRRAVDEVWSESSRQSATDLISYSSATRSARSELSMLQVCRDLGMSSPRAAMKPKGRSADWVLSAGGQRLDIEVKRHEADVYWLDLLLSAVQGIVLFDGIEHDNTFDLTCTFEDESRSVRLELRRLISVLEMLWNQRAAVCAFIRAALGGVQGGSELRIRAPHKGHHAIELRFWSFNSKCCCDLSIDEHAIQLLSIAKPQTSEAWDLESTIRSARSVPASIETHVLSVHQEKLCGDAVEKTKQILRRRKNRECVDIVDVILIHWCAPWNWAWAPISRTPALLHASDDRGALLGQLARAAEYAAHQDSGIALPVLLVVDGLDGALVGYSPEYQRVVEPLTCRRP